MRGLFTDGFNSFWHFLLGIITFYFPFIIVFYMLYQYCDPNDVNIKIDVIEYLISYVSMIIYWGLSKK